MVAASWGCTYKMAASRPRSFLLGEAVGKKKYTEAKLVYQPTLPYPASAMRQRKGKQAQSIPSYSILAAFLTWTWDISITWMKQRQR
jgi:hypothetical protein